jgi:hypothetical protein
MDTNQLSIGSIPKLRFSPTVYSELQNFLMNRYRNWKRIRSPGFAKRIGFPLYKISPESPVSFRIIFIKDDFSGARILPRSQEFLLPENPHSPHLKLQRSEENLHQMIDFINMINYFMICRLTSFRSSLFPFLQKE